MSNKKKLLLNFSGSSSGLDPNVEAYFLANGITDSSIVNAVNAFVLGLKSNSIYSKFKSIHFLFMGTAFANKFNLINPLDTDAAHRYVFNGGITHGTKGITPNGTNGYVDTKVNSLSHLNPANNHFALYSRTNTQNDGFHGMALVNSQTIQTYLRGSYYYDELRIANGSSNGGVIVSGQISSIGFYINNRRTSTSLKLFKNGTQLGIEQNQDSFDAQSQNLFIGARSLNGNNPSGHDNRELSYCSTGQGFTDAEALNYSNLLQTLLTTLSI